MHKIMGLLNYTTGIDSLKSAGEIQGLLAAKGAKSINIDFQNGEPVALWFMIEFNEVEINFKLPCNWEGVELAMKADRKIQPRYKTREQAKRVAWRIVKDWVEVQLAFIESNQAKMVQVFLPYVVTGNGQTLFERMVENPGRFIAYEGG